MNEDRKKFLERLQKEAAQRDDGIAEDWKKLVKSGTIQKIMETEQKYKESGGYHELDSTEEDIEK